MGAVRLLAETDTRFVHGGQLVPVSRLPNVGILSEILREQPIHKNFRLKYYTCACITLYGS